MRDHRIRRAQGMQAAPSAGPRATRVPRLRLGRNRAPRGRRARLRPGGRQPPEPEARGRPERLHGDARPRSHALGDARRCHRGERPSAHRLRRREALDRPERNRRELPRAAWPPAGRRPRVHLGNRRGVRLAPHRAPLRRRPRRGGPQGLRRARGALRVRRDPPRPPRPARRHTPALPARRGRRRGRDVPRLERRCVPQARPAPSSSPTIARSLRSRPTGSRSPTRTAARSSTTRSCSTGTTRAPRRAATRHSC